MVTSSATSLLFCLNFLFGLTKAIGPPPPEPVTMSPQMVEPDVTVSPQRVEADIGTNITLTCNDTAAAASDFVWFFSNQLNCSNSSCSEVFFSFETTLAVQDIQELISNGNSIGNTSVLNVSISSFEQGGQYTCVAINGSDVRAGFSAVLVRPYILTDFEDISIPFKDKVLVECEAEAFPNTVTVTWQRSGSPTDEFMDVDSSNVKDDKLFIYKAVLNDTGIYQCVADNGISSTFKRFNLTVTTIAPVFIKIKGTKYLEEGDDLELYCLTKGGPDNIITWTLNGVELTESNNINITTETKYHLKTKGSLSINDITATIHKGIYTCNVTNEGGSREASITVTVSPFGLVSSTPTLTISSRGNNATLHCETTAGPNNTFIWLYNVSNLVCRQSNCSDTSFMLNATEEEMIRSVIAVSPVLQLFNVTPVDNGGEYICGVINEAGTGLSHSYINFPPDILQDPTDITAEQGDSAGLSFSCEAEGFPFPVYQWQRENISSMGFMDVIDETNTELMFGTVEFDFTGNYRCVALNTINDTIREENSEIASFHVSPNGSVVVDQQVINGTVNSSYSVMCTAMGGVENMFKWRYTKTGQILTNLSVLMLEMVSARDGGIYECFVFNEAGFQSAFLTLNIETTILQGPISRNYSASLESIVLNCTASGFPLPSVTWFRNNNLVQDSNRLELVSFKLSDDGEGTVVSLLRINNPDVINDTGVYVCVASNIEPDEPVTSDPADIFIQDVPEVPLSVNANNVFSRNLTLSWIIPRDNNAPILGYYIFYNQPSFIDEGSPVVVTLNENTDELIIEKLHPGQYYNFTVIAFNEEGNSTVSEYHQVRTLEEAPDGAPQNVRGSPISSTEISVKWDHILAINRLGVVVSYDVMYSAVEVIDSEVIMNIKEQQVSLTGLTRFTTYNISVRGRTLEGPGPFSEPVIMVLTNQSIPSPVPSAIVTAVSSTSVLLVWSIPDDPNGIILSYNVEVEPLRFDTNPYSTLPLQGKRSTESITIFSCYEYLRQSVMLNFNVKNTSTNITSLVPFTLYQARVAASTVIGTGNYSSYAFFTTLEDLRGAVLNLTGIVRNSTSVVIQWRAPLCPNGQINSYRLYYREANATQSIPIHSNSEYSSFIINSSSLVISTIVNGLSSSETYAFHVRALSIENEPGLVDTEILITLSSSQISLIGGELEGVVNRVSVGATELTIGLPSTASLATIGITNIQFYGVVVIPKPDPNFMIGEDDFDATYPNLQPYGNRGDNRYYIGAGWNNLSIIPDNFEVGDNGRTTAIRNGIEEEYLNKELNRFTSYCFYVLIHYESDIGNELVVRYIELSCQKTGRGYSLTGLIVGLILAVLLLLMCCVLVGLICCCYCRKRRKYKMDSRELDTSLQFQVLFKNPAFRPGGTYKRVAVPVGDYSVYVETMHADNDAMFISEFENVEPHHAPTTIAFDSNPTKNRSKNVSAYDHSRVVLTNRNLPSDYINANHIKGHGGSHNFIAAQGPLGNTVDEFWAMVWEQNVSIVVMLMNREEEKESDKYHRYWPEFFTGITECGLFRVELKEEINEDNYITRHFALSNEYSTREVIQYQYYSWNNDYNTLGNRRNLLDFIQTVRASYHTTSSTIKELNQQSTVVVHCSDGAGKTGIFIAIAAQLDRAETERTIHIFDYVQYMRRQRAYMVNNEAQYIYVHDIILDAVNQLERVEGGDHVAETSFNTIENPYVI